MQIKRKWFVEHSFSKLCFLISSFLLPKQKNKRTLTQVGSRNMFLWGYSHVILSYTEQILHFSHALNSSDVQDSQVPLQFLSCSSEVHQDVFTQQFLQVFPWTSRIFMHHLPHSSLSPPQHSFNVVLRFPKSYKVSVLEYWLNILLLCPSGREWDPRQCFCEGSSSIPSGWDFGRMWRIGTGCGGWQPFAGGWTADHRPIIWRGCWAGGRARGRGSVASRSGEHGEIQSRETETFQSEEGNDHKLGFNPTQKCSVRHTVLTESPSAGRQPEEGILATEYWEEDDKDRNKDCFSGATGEDQTENFQPEGFTSEIQHQEGTVISITKIYQSENDQALRSTESL